MEIFLLISLTLFSVLLVLYIRLYNSLKMLNKDYSQFKQEIVEIDNHNMKTLKGIQETTITLYKEIPYILGLCKAFKERFEEQEKVLRAITSTLKILVERLQKNSENINVPDKGGKSWMN